jgi:hypothetical protein
MIFEEGATFDCPGAEYKDNDDGITVGDSVFEIDTVLRFMSRV